MAAYHRDSFVELLRRRERGEEDVFFGRRDEELIAHMREQRRELEEAHARRSAHMRCPECGVHLTLVMRRGVPTEECPSGHGLWIPAGTLETITTREHDAWFDRYVHVRW